LLNLAWHWLEWPPVEMLAPAADIAHSLHPLLMPTRNAAQAVTIHDLDFLDHPDRARAEIRRDYPRLTGSHARRADLVVTNSDHTAAIVVGRLGVEPHRVIVCPPGAPAWPARPAPEHVGPILFVGTIEPRKNLPILFSAYEQVVRTDPGAPPLVLAGKTVEHSAAILGPASAKPALDGRIRHLGYVTDEQRSALYREASMLVLPSLDEGFGMTALEAMHVGVPVIASNRGALPDLVGDAGILVDPLDEVALVTAISGPLQDPNRRMHLAEQGQARARQFTWASSAARLLGGYREALARVRRERRP
jgi:glycosyltransferase involved in cell wall biosynthesis